MQSKDTGLATINHLAKMVGMAEQYVDIAKQLTPGPKAEQARADVDAAKLHLLRLRTEPAAEPAAAPDSPTPELVQRGVDSIFRDITQIAVAAQPVVDVLVKLGARFKP